MKNIRLLLWIIILVFYFESIYANTQDSLIWHSIKDLQQLENNLEDKKFIMIDFYTDWWGACKLLDANTFSNKEIINLTNNHFISFKINAGLDSGSKLFNEYKGFAFPLIIFLNNENIEIDNLSKIIVRKRKFC